MRQRTTRNTTIEQNTLHACHLSSYRGLLARQLETRLLLATPDASLPKASPNLVVFTVDALGPGAQRGHIRPNLLDVNQTVLLFALLTRLAPALRLCRWARSNIVPHIIDDY